MNANTRRPLGRDSHRRGCTASIADTDLGCQIQAFDRSGNQAVLLTFQNRRACITIAVGMGNRFEALMIWSSTKEAGSHEGDSPRRRCDRIEVRVMNVVTPVKGRRI